MSPPKIRPRPGPVHPLARAVIYGLLGCWMELVFTGLTGPVRGGHRGPSTSPLMLPIYALALPLFEPVHDRLRGRMPLVVRAAVYAGGIEVIEYASGSLLRRVAGRAPWDYRHARLHIDGLVRLDYLPLWAIAGLGGEWLHDRLMRRRPARAR